MCELAGEPLWVNGDFARLTQVLANLLNNAAKYTEPGGRIVLALERCGGDAVVRVIDTGIGIRPESLATIFELFAQVDRTLDRAQGGLGVGLTLVQRLVELHGGSVQASSAGPGQGAEFIVRLPLRARGRKATRRRQIRVPHAGHAGLPRFCWWTTMSIPRRPWPTLLRMEGHETDVVYDGESALQRAQAMAPDAVSPGHRPAGHERLPGRARAACASRRRAHACWSP